MSLAIALSWSPRCMRATWMVIGLLSLGAPALAVEQVYIWRDQNGAVRFSPVQEPERTAERAVNPSATREHDAPPAVVVTDSTQRSGN